MKKKPMRKIITGICIVAILGIIGFLYLRDGKTIESYPLYELKKGDIEQTFTASGFITGKDARFYAIEQTEKILEILVKEGDLVQGGEVLIRFDIEKELRELSQDIEEAKLSLESATLQLENIIAPASGNTRLQYEGDVQTMEKNYLDAENDIVSLTISIEQQEREISDLTHVYDRHKTLYDHGVLSEREFEQTSLQLKRAEDLLDDLIIQKDSQENLLHLREKQLINAEKKLMNALDVQSDDKTKISMAMQEITVSQANLEIKRLENQKNDLVYELVAVEGGTVKSINVEVGEYATKGMLLIETEDLTDLYVAADISEFDSLHTKIGQKVSIQSAGLADISFMGIVESISAHGIKKETSSGDEVFVPVKIKLTTETPFKSGFSVDLTLIIEEKTAVLMIPMQSFAMTETGEARVFIQGENGEITGKNITLGFQGDKEIEVISGLEAGDKIILQVAEIVDWKDK